MRRGAWLFLLMTVVVLLPAEKTSDGLPAVVMLTQVLVPIACRTGIKPVHHGAIIAATEQISVLTRPVGINLLAAYPVARVSPSEQAQALAPFLFVLLAIMLIVAFAAQLTLFLPCLVGYRQARRNPLHRGSSAGAATEESDQVTGCWAVAERRSRSNEKDRSSIVPPAECVSGIRSPVSRGTSSDESA